MVPLRSTTGYVDFLAWQHTLYGHIAGTEAYSVGAWLTEVRAYLGDKPPVIVGGTGLYFT
ncbi:MAG: tRNA (adenosine(37)-N6)-dimethylallyltransferase MiaA, partial [Pseudomonadota bacterium]